MQEFLTVDDTRAPTMLRRVDALDDMIDPTPTPIDALRVYMACVVLAGFSTAIFATIVAERRYASLPILILGLLWAGVYLV